MEKELVMKRTIATILQLNEKVSLEDAINAKIGQMADVASEETKSLAAAMVSKAKSHSPATPIIEMVEWTAELAAYVVHHHNTFNRFWTAEHSIGLADDMVNGRWKRNHAGYAWYSDGAWADGAHRLRGQAVSGVALMMPTYFSMEKADVGSIDCGKGRKPKDAAALAGVFNAKEKAEVLGAIWAYEKAAKLVVQVPQHNVTAVALEIQRNDALLGRAIEIGETSPIDVDRPLLGERIGGKIAGILLKHGWPDDRLVELLDMLQTRNFDDDKAPLAKVHNFIEKNRPPKDALTPGDEVRLIIKALLLEEEGVLITGRRMNDITNATSNPPDPTYPAPAPKADAA
jgi:hypothetical protein